MADRLRRLVRDDRPVVHTDGEVVEVIAPVAQEPREHRLRASGPGRRGPHPEPPEGLGRLLAHAPQAPDRERVQVRVDSAGPHHHHAVGFAASRGELGDQLGGRDATEHRTPISRWTSRRILAPDLLGLAEQQVRARDVEEGLVERDRFDRG